MLLMASSGSGRKTYVDDVFSTYLYTGNGSTQTITNGIDLAGKGGLVWIKNRPSSDYHGLYDTERGATKWIASNDIAAQTTQAQHLTAFTSTGFSVGTSNVVNGSTNAMASWTFRKAPKFFDVVAWIGDGQASNRAIPHALSVAPGMIIVKTTNAARDWYVYHPVVGVNQCLILNSTIQATGCGNTFGPTVPNASNFYVGDSNNTLGVTYIAYVFAHDTDPKGLIQCGSFTADGSGNATVNLGWEPQYVLCKNGGVGNWFIEDTMRGMSQTGAQWLYAQGSDAEAVAGGWSKPTATGFNAYSRGASNTFIYLAIRRPNKPPTVGTQVYSGVTYTGNGAANRIIPATIIPDLALWMDRGAGGYPFWTDRLRGQSGTIRSNDTNAETDLGAVMNYFDVMSNIKIGYELLANVSAHAYIYSLFRRAPGFMDIVCYTGTGVARTVAHNLGAVPELMIVKNRTDISNWAVRYSTAVSSGYGMFLNTTDVEQNATAIWTTTAPTASIFPVGTVNDSNSNNENYVAYLFATLAGISKVGSYTGNGTTQTINCGFSTGARFVLIKRTDSTGDWYVWDTARGIVAANDPHLSLNTTLAEVTTDDSIDPHASGFTVNQVAATNINVTSATYIYLSIA